MHQTCNAQSAAPQEGRVLKRRLENRHIQLISISGAIGTGLFMGSGKIIALSGTSIILVYAIIGFFVFCIMRAMGDTMIISPPLVITKDEIDELVTKARKCLDLTLEVLQG